MIPVGKHICLLGQKDPTGIHQVHTGQLVVHGDLLGTEMLLDGLLDISSSLDGSIVGNENRFPAMDHTDTGNDTGRRMLVVHDVVRGQGREFQKWRVGIDQLVDAFTCQQLATFFMLLNRFSGRL